MLTGYAEAEAGHSPTGVVEIQPQQRLLRDGPQYSEAVLPPQQSLFRRITKYPALEHYNRLIFLAAVVNLIMFGMGVSNGWWAIEGMALSQISNMALANFTVAILIRQQYVINLLFWLATRAPTSWPLSIRWNLAKVYHFGGLHSGCAVIGTIWFALFLGALLHHHHNGLPGVSRETLMATYALIALLVMIVALALPPIRSRFHNQFELMHRLGGWTALGLFWIQTILFVRDQSVAQAVPVDLLATPAIWILAVLTFSIVLPWLRLRKVEVKIKKPSSHVTLVEFDHGVRAFPGSSTAVSRNPLIEWHSFANVPAPGTDAFRLTISRAGDWTGKFIDDTPSRVWVKGIPTAGVANIEVLFKRVVYVATGSGIGPVLPHLLAHEVPSHLVWSTRSPRKTYGDELVDEILEAEPHAFIWDTVEHGKPDMVKLAYQAYRNFNAEAVICIANQKLTREVVFGMESRGIPAYGAIWDS